MGEACLRVFYASNAGDKAAVHFVSRHRSFLPVKPFVAAAHTAPTKATLIRLADTATWACYRKKLQLLGHIPSSTFGAYDY